MHYTCVTRDREEKRERPVGKKTSEREKQEQIKQRNSGNLTQKEGKTENRSKSAFTGQGKSKSAFANTTMLRCKDYF